MSATKYNSINLLSYIGGHWQIESEKVILIFKTFLLSSQMKTGNKHNKPNNQTLCQNYHDFLRVLPSF